MEFKIFTDDDLIFLKQMNSLSNTSLNKLGKKIQNSDVLSEKELLEIKMQINQWRTLHFYPLQAFRVTLARTTTNMQDVVVVQRLKRLPTILNKLKRYPSTSLAKMQDIGGARAICKSIEDIKRIEELLNNKDKRFKYEFIRKKDYIETPKSSGYRGIHLIYKYINDDPQSSGYNSNGLFIELQLRTKLQHIWATAVEVVGIFQQEDLKSSIGNAETLNFFTLCSSAFALLEKSNTVQEHAALQDQEIFNQVVKYYDQSRLKDRLTVGINVVNVINKLPQNKVYLIKLHKTTYEVSVNGYDDIKSASGEYLKAELDENFMTVLVSMQKAKLLRKAYPNYFLDTKDFNSVIESIRKKLNTPATLQPHH